MDCIGPNCTRLERIILDKIIWNWAGKDYIGPNWMELGWKGLYWTKLYGFGLEGIILDQIVWNWVEVLSLSGQGCIRSNCTGLDWTTIELDYSRLYWIELDFTELGWTGLNYNWTRLFWVELDSTDYFLNDPVGQSRWKKIQIDQ